jgi:hypothetical protein
MMSNETIYKSESRNPPAAFLLDDSKVVKDDEA